MSKLKVVTIVGTRPEIIRLSRLIPKLDQFTDHILVHTGQNYDRQLNEVFFEDLELRRPDYYLNVDTSSLASVMSDTLRKTEEVLLKEQPAAVMILGDTNSAVAAIIAERMQIPVYHMEAGNRSFDSNVPEELNRRMIDHVATFNLPYTEVARQNLLREGIESRFVFKTGTPLREVYKKFESQIARSNILAELELEPQNYFLASLHRQENIDSKFRLKQMIEAITASSEKFKKPIIVSAHPRLIRRINEFEITVPELIRICNPFGYHDYNHLQINAYCVISDSGSIAEEAAAMDFAAVSFRDSIERPEAIEEGTVVLASTSERGLLDAIEYAVAETNLKGVPADYQIENFSDRVLGILFSTVGQYRFWKNKTE
jgi:UDP-N-acetylglucosamine 2-epimerase